MPAATPLPMPVDDDAGEQHQQQQQPPIKRPASVPRPTISAFIMRGSTSSAQPSTSADNGSASPSSSPPPSRGPTAPSTGGLLAAARRQNANPNGNSTAAPQTAAVGASSNSNSSSGGSGIMSPFVAQVAYGVAAHRTASAAKAERDRVASLVNRQQGTTQQGTTRQQGSAKGSSPMDASTISNTAAGGNTSGSDAYRFVNPYTDSSPSAAASKLYLTTDVASGVGAMPSIPAGSALTGEYIKTGAMLGAAANNNNNNTTNNVNTINNNDMASSSSLSINGMSNAHHNQQQQQRMMMVGGMGSSYLSRPPTSPARGGGGGGGATATTTPSATPTNTSLLHHADGSPQNTPQGNRSASALARRQQLQENAIRRLEQPLEISGANRSGSSHAMRRAAAEAQFAGKAFAGLAAAAGVIHGDRERAEERALLRSSGSSSTAITAIRGGGRDGLALVGGINGVGTRVSSAAGAVGGGSSPVGVVSLDPLRNPPSRPLSRAGGGATSGLGIGPGTLYNPTNTRLPGPERKFAHQQRPDVMAAMAAQSATQYGTTRPMTSPSLSTTTSAAASRGGGGATIPINRMRGDSVGVGKDASLAVVLRQQDQAGEGEEGRVVYDSTAAAGDPAVEDGGYYGAGVDDGHHADFQTQHQQQQSVPSPSAEEAFAAASLPSYWAEGYLLDKSRLTSSAAAARKKAPLTIIASRQRRRMDVPIEQVRAEQEVHAAQRLVYDTSIAPDARRMGHLVANGGAMLLFDGNNANRTSTHANAGANSGASAAASELIEEGGGANGDGEHDRLDTRYGMRSTASYGVGVGGSPQMGMGSPPSSPRHFPVDPYRAVVHDSSGLPIPSKLRSSSSAVATGVRASSAALTMGIGGGASDPRRRRPSVPHALFGASPNSPSRSASALNAAIRTPLMAQLQRQHEGMRALGGGGGGESSPPLLLDGPPVVNGAMAVGGGHSLSPSPARGGALVVASPNGASPSLSSSTAGGGSAVIPPRPASRLQDLRYSSTVAETIASTEQWTPFKDKRDTVQLMRRDRLGQVAQRREQDGFMSDLQHTAIQSAADFWRRNPNPTMAMKKFDRLVVMSELAKSSDGTVFLGNTQPVMSPKDSRLVGKHDGSASSSSPPTTVASAPASGDQHTMQRYKEYHGRVMGKQYPSYAPQVWGSGEGSDGAGNRGGSASPTRPPSHLRKKKPFGGSASPTSPSRGRSPSAAATKERDGHALMNTSSASSSVGLGLLTNASTGGRDLGAGVGNGQRRASSPPIGGQLRRRTSLSSPSSSPLAGGGGGGATSSAAANLKGSSPIRLVPKEEQDSFFLTNKGIFSPQRTDAGRGKGGGMAPTAAAAAAPLVGGASATEAAAVETSSVAA